MSGVIDPNDAAAIRAIAEHLAELRLERIRAASRLASDLEARVRPIGDKQLLDLAFRLQLRLSMLLPEKPDGDGPV